MDKQKKTLLCMYVDDFCGIKEESFNFYIERRYTIKKGTISRKSDEEIKDFPKNFWGVRENVSAVTLLIGENGAGKTTLMRLLIKWLCQLSVGHIPQEKGALVISVGDEDKLIVFGDGKPWKITIDNIENIVCIVNTDEIKEMLSDIRLAYYTDTMTDLELSDVLTEDELKFLRDDSLFTRLSNSMKGKYAVDSKSIKDCIKREDFARQMELFFDMFSYRKENPDSELEFPIRYMKLTTIKAGDKKGFKKIADDNDSLAGEAIDLWNEVFSGNANNKLPDIARDLLWGVFSGTIILLLQWEKREFPKLQESIITKQIGDSLRAYIAYVGTRYDDWNAVFKSFFTNMFSDFERGFNDEHLYEEFRTVWDKQVEDNIEGFLNALKKIESGEFLSKWKLAEKAQDTQNMWEFRLEYFNEDKKDKEEQSSLIQNWKNLWEYYLKVAHLMPECRFDWKYASSGGKNKSNLYTNLFNVFNRCSGRDTDTGINQLWVLLDEPDNTFHPDWERGIIKNILEICSDSDKNFQILISTHSPIMLSDVPKQAAILMKLGEENKNSEENKNITKEKQQESPKSSPFGQQIYTLFNDAFFMEHGIIGGFADIKIGEVYKGLHEMEEQLSEKEDSFDEEKMNVYEQDLENYECIIKLIEEPLLHGLLSQSYKLCKRRIKELR